MEATTDLSLFANGNGHSSGPSVTVPIATCETFQCCTCGEPTRNCGPNQRESSCMLTRVITKRQDIFRQPVVIVLAVSIIICFVLGVVLLAVGLRQFYLFILERQSAQNLPTTPDPHIKLLDRFTSSSK